MKTKGIIKYNNMEYIYNVKEVGKLYGGDEEWVHIICKGANFNDTFLKEDLDLVINEIIPSFIEIKIEDNKSSNLQIRLRKADKEKLKELAKKEKISISDLIINKTLANYKV